MEDLEKIEQIIDWFKKQIRDNQPISPEMWLRGAQKLNILSDSETRNLFELHQVVATDKMVRIASGDSVAKANVFIETTDTYKEMCIQKARIERIEEMIRLAKIQARMANDAINHQ